MKRKAQRKEVAVIGLRGFPDIQGGVEKHCEALYPLMSDLHVRVYRRTPYVVEKNSRWENISFVDLPSGRKSGLEALLHTGLSACHIIFHRPDLVHVHNIGPGLFIPMLRLFGIKVVMTYHSPNYEHDKWGFFARNILRAGEMLSLKFANRIIFVNKAQMQKYGEKIRRKSTLILNGVKQEGNSEDTDYIESLGLTKGNYLLGVGRLTPEKGFEYLVKAANLVPEIEHVVIAGGSDSNSSYPDKLKSLDKAGKVIFTGNLQGEPLRQLYSHAGLFCLSSINEGFPLVMLEAMSHDLPIVATRIPATDIPQISDENKATPADEDSLAEALRRNWKTRAPKKYDLSSYNWNEIARQTEEVYNEIL